MFGIGGGEILVIALITLIAVGPEQLPSLMRKFGNYAAQLRSMADGVRTEFMHGMDELDPDKWTGDGTDTAPIVPRGYAENAIGTTVGPRPKPSTEPPTTEPPTTEPSTTEPSTTEPSSTGPSTTGPSTTEPSIATVISGPAALEAAAPDTARTHDGAPTRTPGEPVDQPAPQPFPEPATDDNDGSSSA